MSSCITEVIRAKLRVNGYYDILLKGRCMEPLLRLGDRARVYPKGDIRVGDIALLELKSGVNALHRIVRINGRAVTAKGDFSGKAEVVNIDDVIGIAQEFSLAGKGWIKDLRSYDDLLKLVELSLYIIDKRCDEANKAYRDMIWAVNQAARKSMLNSIDEC